MSATKAEYIAALEAKMIAVWIRKFISRLGIVPTINKPIKMFCDNSVPLLIANEPRVQKGAKHYHRRYHYVRECIKLGEINLFKVHTYDNLADPFTNALPKGKLTQHARSMRLHLASSFTYSGQPFETTFKAATSVPTSPKSNSSGKRRNRKACFVLLTPSKPVSNTGVRPISAALPNITMTRPRHAHQVLVVSTVQVKGNLVRGLPTKVFENDHTCVACKKGKQHRASCKTKPVSSIDQPLFRLHMDLFGPTFVKSMNKKSYCLVITDDSRFTWVFFLATKDKTTLILKTFLTGLENQLSLKFYEMKGIKKEFSVPRTPQQNGIAERKNMTLIEATRTILVDSLLPILFWAEAVNTACYVQNRVLVTKPHNKTPYELLHENKPNLVGSGPTWLFDIDSLIRTMNYQPVIAGNQTNPSAGFQDKFDAEKAREEIDQQYVLFPMWSSGSTNHQNYDGDADFDEKEHDFDAKKPHAKKPESEVILSLSSSAQSRKQDDKKKKEAKGKIPIESFIGYRHLNAEFEDCSDNNSNEVNAAGFIVFTVGQNSLNTTNTFSVAGPSNAAVSPTYEKSSFIDASQLPDDPDMPKLEDITYSDDEDVVGAMADFNNLESSIPVSPIPTTRIHKDHPISQIIVARIEAIRLFLAYASFMGLWCTKWMSRVLLYETIKEEVYVCQPLGFEDPDHPDKVYKVVKALYGLHQAPRACQDKYVAEILRKFGLTEGKSASTPIDTEKPLLKDPDGEDVDVHTYRSMIGSLIYLTSSRPDIMFAVCACARFQVTPKASHLHAVKRIFRYLKGKPHLGLWYPKDSPFDLVAYSDSDYAGASLDKKSTTGGCQFLGCRLISWQCKKQTVVATSSTKAEYVVAASCCAQVVLSGMESLKRMSHVSYILSAGYLTTQQVVLNSPWQTATGKEISNPFMAGGVDCLPNEEIFAELARMGYEKPSTKLTFYKAFFSSQWKFLIHIILQSMSAKRTSWNEFTSAMASSNCLSEPSIPTPTPPTPPPPPPQDLPLTSQVHHAPPQSPQVQQPSSQPQPQQTANFPMSLLQEALDACAALTRRVKHLEVKVLKLRMLKRVGTSQRVDTSEDTVMNDASNHGRIIDELDKDEVVSFMDDKEEDKKEEEAKVVEDDQVQGRQAKSQAKIYKIDMDHALKVLIIRDPEEESATSSIIPADTKSKDKGKRIMVEEPKPLKKKQQVEMDEKYARKLHAELNKDFDWDAAIDHVKQKAKEDLAVQRYQVMKRKPQTKAQARKNMIMYLKNVVGFRLDYFKGMSYDDILPIFEVKFNSNMDFLLNTKEQMEQSTTEHQ
nr:uncharacterized mitochondrial protein AtMg00810-like [Tanacetum cinerariifolium]